MNKILTDFVEADMERVEFTLTPDECETLIKALGKVKALGFELIGLNFCAGSGIHYSAQILFRTEGSIDPKDHFREEILL